MAAQIIYLTLVFITLLLNAYLHGKEKIGKHNFFAVLITYMILLLLLYWGGFFDVFFK